MKQDLHTAIFTTPIVLALLFSSNDIEDLNEIYKY